MIIIIIIIIICDLFTCYFKFRLAHKLRYAPCGASYAVHTDSFTAHNNHSAEVFKCALQMVLIKQYI